ncbi:hypothetical protein NC653_026217 [Populus alba x Populus x berolinensis]|uniref:Uncharacterized protein n=1 Tax=Populus alba x Populus x berolinensis TaxID=444605 RepID=A0AAD6MDM5_9ROSI|nr:hypothetical protein NC653_026217 [Populus alba x Populus x berolinensis]
MGKASYDGRFIRAPSPTLKARVCKGSIVIFKRIRFSLRAKRKKGNTESLIIQREHSTRIDQGGMVREEEED